MALLELPFTCCCHTACLPAAGVREDAITEVLTPLVCFVIRPLGSAQQSQALCGTMRRMPILAVVEERNTIVWLT